MQIEDYITWRSGDLVSGGHILEIKENGVILVDTGYGGGRGLEYINKEDVLETNMNDYTD